MATLEETINQAISDFDDIKAAIEECGVDVPYDTDTSQYGKLIKEVGGTSLSASIVDGIFVLTSQGGTKQTSSIVDGALTIV